MLAGHYIHCMHPRRDGLSSHTSSTHHLTFPPEMSSPSQINEDEELASSTCFPFISIGLWTSSLGLAVESKTPNYHLTHPHQLMTEERDDVIIRWIKPQVEDHPEFSLYTESKAKMPHLSKVIKQYMIVSVMLGQLSGLIMLIDYDGAPSCTVKMVRTNIRSTGIYWVNYLIP